MVNELKNLKLTLNKTINKLFLFPRICYSTFSYKLLWTTIVITERCNSRCKTCGIWKKKNPKNMSVELFKKIINGVPKGVHINITGGEPLLHPKINEMLSLLKLQNRSFTLLSNGILADELISTVRNNCVKNLEISCDGPEATYEVIRGVNNYKNIVRIIQELRDQVEIGVNYTVNPLNSRKDLIKVKKMCESYGVHLAIGVYNNPEYFDTFMEKKEIYDASGLTSYPVNKFIELYNSWINSNLRIPCYSIRFSCFILPNGDVLVCQGKNVILGNLNNHSLNEIWKKSKDSGIHRKLKNCNGCWMLCHRSYDVGLILTLKTLMPKIILEKIVGKLEQKI